MTDDDEVLEQLAAWRRDGKKVAVATVVTTWGSSPRPVGSMLGISDEIVDRALSYRAIEL